MNYEPMHGWSFAWSGDRAHITSIVAWSRRECIRLVEEMMGVPWRKTYRQGGRIIKTEIRPR